MGLLEKFKDLFTDVDEVIETKEVEIEEDPIIEKEDKLPTFMREKIEREEREKNIILEKEEEPIKTREELNKNQELIKPNNFRFPIDYDDDELEKKEIVKEKIKKEEKPIEKIIKEPKVVPKPELYAANKEQKEKEEAKKFIATPIISPVYGVLDKNYSKEELRSKEENDYDLKRPSKKIDFDSVRKKAYGTLTDDIKENMMCENCELLKEIKENIKIDKIDEENLLYDITEEKENKEAKIDNITMEEARENYYDYGHEYNHKEEVERNPELSIDKEDEEVKIVNHNLEDSEASKIEVKEDLVEERSKIDLDEIDNEEPGVSVDDTLELTDDLFNLIDSMYQDKEE